MTTPNKSLRQKLKLHADHYGKNQLLLLLFCLVLAAIFILSPRLFSLAYGYIDPSFNYAVNTAAAQRIPFGTDFIATYGPLGYLVANYLPAELVKASIGMLLYAIAVGAGSFWFVNEYIKTTKGKWLAAIALIYALSITNGGGSLEWGYLTTFLLYCFIYIRASRRNQWLLAIGLSLVAAIFSLTKFTLGFSSIASLVLVCLLATNNPWRIKLKQCGLAVIVYASMFVLLGHYFGITDFVAYVRTAWIESANFGTAMSLYDKQTASATIFAAIALLGILIWPILFGRKKFITYLFLVPSLVTIWKYSVARQDDHILRLLQVSIPLAVILFLVLGSRLRKNQWMIWLVLICSSIAIWGNKIPFSGDYSFSTAVTAPIANVRDRGFVHFFNISGQKQQWAEQSAVQLADAQIPASMKAQIGSTGVDIFPWETDIIAANNLTWQNRPSPFSFETYDPYLDNLNAAYFMSSKAPEYILWHSTGVGAYGVDQRQIMWDEPKTLRAILKNYQVQSSNNNFILLQRRSQPVPLNETSLNLTAADLQPGKWHKLNTSNNQTLTFVQFKEPEDIGSKIATAAVRGQPAYIAVKTASGKVTTYRFVPENSGQGLLIGGLPMNWQQIIELLENHNTQTNDPITDFKIITK